MSKSINNILVTGGAGYIGSHVCHLLIDQGYNVTCIDSLITGNKELLPKEVKLEIFDISNKEKVKLVYDGNNEMSYTSIGKILIKKEYINRDNVNLFTIKEWLRANSDLSEELMNQNERFIFFKEISFGVGAQPVGAFGTPLMPNYSIAVDKNIYPLGLPFFIQIEKDKSILPVVSLDTGGAIIGANRADLFFGRGELAERKAGILKKKIYLHAFIPYSN